MGFFAPLGRQLSANQPRPSIFSMALPCCNTMAGGFHGCDNPAIENPCFNVPLTCFLYNFCSRSEACPNDPSFIQHQGKTAFRSSHAFACDRLYGLSSQVTQNIHQIGDGIGHVSQTSQQVADVTAHLAGYSEKEVGHLLVEMNNFMEELNKIT